jgi:hypothetical protein
MNVKQVVSMDFSSGNLSYFGLLNALEFYDANKNEVRINISDSQLMEFAKCVNDRVQRIQKDRDEKAAKLQEMEG